MIENGRASSRAGLLATQGIRGKGLTARCCSASRKYRRHIYGHILTRNWVLDGAAVHTSIVGFDDGSELNSPETLDGVLVVANLSTPT